MFGMTQSVVPFFLNSSHSPYPKLSSPGVGTRICNKTGHNLITMGRVESYPSSFLTIKKVGLIALLFGELTVLKVSLLQFIYKLKYTHKLIISHSLYFEHVRYVFRFFLQIRDGSTRKKNVEKSR